MSLNKWNSIKEREVIGKFVVLFTGKKMAFRIILLFALFIILSVLLFSETFASPLDNWNMRTSGTNSGLNTVIYSNNTFVAVGNGGVILTSPDGSKWTARNSGTNNNLNGVTYGNGTFVAVGVGGIILQSDSIDSEPDDDDDEDGGGGGGGGGCFISTPVVRGNFNNTTKRR